MMRTKKVNKWAQSIQKARKELNVKGFVAINRGTLGKQLYQRAKQLHQSGGSGCGVHNPLIPHAGGYRTNLIGGRRTVKRGGSKKSMSWVQSISRARKQLGIKGFVAINRGSQGKQLYQLAKQMYK